MAKRSQKLGRIVALAGIEEKKLGELTGRSQAELNAQVEKLGALNAYRSNYAAKARAADAYRSAHWKDYQGFLHRLDEALRSQQQVVRDCEAAVAVHRRQWMAKRQRLESLERVLERFEQEEAITLERREQRSLDDLVAKPEGYEDDST